MRLNSLYECAATYLNSFTEKPKTDFPQSSSRKKTNIVQKIDTDNRTIKASSDCPSKQNQDKRNMKKAQYSSTDSESSPQSTFEQTLQDICNNTQKK